jgi:hypothetical protein
MRANPAVRSSTSSTPNGMPLSVCERGWLTRPRSSNTSAGRTSLGTHAPPDLESGAAQWSTGHRHEAVLGAAKAINSHLQAKLSRRECRQWILFDKRSPTDSRSRASLGAASLG